MMMMRTVTLTLAAALTLCSQVAHAQSLADVARAEEARRKADARPAKIYTNEDLSGTLPPSAAPAGPAKPAPAQAAAAADKAAPKDEAKDEKTTEQYWKRRASALRETLARNKVLVEAMQSRINALNTEALNAHEPGQAAASEKNLTAATHEMERLKQETQKATQDLAAVEDEARKANIPPGWLR